jgi:hypothetical protein
MENKYTVENILNVTKTTSVGQALRRSIAKYKDEKQIKAIINTLIQGVQENIIDESDSNSSSRKTPLHLAIERSNYAAVECLLEHNANYNIEDANDDTALCLAAKSLDLKMRALIFKKVVQDALKKIEKKYYFENKDSEDGKKIYEAICNEYLIDSGVFNGLFAVSRIYIDPKDENTKNCDKDEYFKFLKLVEFFSVISLGKKYQSKYEKLYNYCQQQCFDLAFELFRFKAFRKGKIPLSMVRYSWTDKIEHVVLFVSFLKESEIKEDSILCNPKKNTFYCGSEEISNYLSRSIYCKNIKPDLSTLALNLRPDFEHFVVGKTEYQELLKSLEESYLEEAKKNKDEYMGATRKAIETFAQLVYNTSQSNLSINEVLSKRLDVIGQLATTIKSILDKQISPTSTAPKIAFYSTPTTGSDDCSIKNKPTDSSETFNPYSMEDQF